MSDNEMYMRRALELARRAEGCTSPNPMVGCVIADADGKIVGEGWHHKAGTPHAEVNAIADMNAKQLQGHTAFVTLEPCSHWGRTGPCCEALIKAGIKRVVAAMEDPNPKVAGNGFRRLREAGVEVITGVCENEARRLNEHFLLWVTQNRPFVSLKFAETLDGKLATSARDSHFVTGQEAHTYSHYLRKIHDAILVGIGTVLDDDPELEPEDAAGVDADCAGASLLPHAVTANSITKTNKTAMILFIKNLLKILIHHIVCLFYHKCKYKNTYKKSSLIAASL